MQLFALKGNIKEVKYNFSFMLSITTAIKLESQKNKKGSHNITVHVDSSYVVFNLENCVNGRKLKILNQHGT